MQLVGATFKCYWPVIIKQSQLSYLIQSYFIFGAALQYFAYFPVSWVQTKQVIKKPTLIQGNSWRRWEIGFPNRREFSGLLPTAPLKHLDKLLCARKRPLPLLIQNETVFSL